MTEDEIRRLLVSLEGTRILIGSEEAGTPELSWGDTFCFYDPEGTGDQKIPFVTIVTRNVPGWDEASDLDPPGRFRVNMAVGRQGLPEAADPIDYSVADTVLPHPQYARQGWVSVVNPGETTREDVADLIGIAYRRAVDRHRPRR